VSSDRDAASTLSVLRHRVAELADIEAQALRAREQLQEREELLRLLVEGAEDTVIFYDLDGRYLYYHGPEQDAFTGDDVVGKTPFDLYGASQAQRIVDQIRRVAATGERMRVENTLLREGSDKVQQETLWCLDDIYPIHSTQGTISGVACVRRNITDQKRTEGALQQRNLELSVLNRAAQVFNSTLDPDEVLARVLEEVRNLLGIVASSIWLIEAEATDGQPMLTCRQATGPGCDVVRGWRLAMGRGFVGWVARSGQSLIVPDVREDPRHFEGVDAQTGLELRSILSVPLRNKDVVIGVLQVVDSQVNRFGVEDLRVLEPLAASAAIAIENARLYERSRREIAERERAQAALRASLEEKVVLLQEIHHRVKNNLQVICSLLDLQAETIQDPEARWAFQESQDRVRSMALVHESLYRSEDLARIDMAEYVDQELHYLFAAYGGLGMPVRTRVRVERVSLGIDTAIPCGLIVNELVTNALKHAFPSPQEIESEEGEICILLYAQDGQYTLEVSDNGVGLPQRQEETSLGLHLVRLLARQLGGTLDASAGRPRGTTYTLRFAERTPERPIDQVI
jgi:PAS domain S-box-containing protein